MTYPTTAAESVALVDVLDPAAVGATATTGGSIQFGASSGAYASQAVAILSIGACNGTVDFELRQATDTAFGTEKEITGKAITQLTASDDNEQAIINLDASELDTANGYDTWRWKATTGGDTNVLSVVVLATDASYGPASDYNVATVATGSFIK